MSQTFKIQHVRYGETTMITHHYVELLEFSQKELMKILEYRSTGLIDCQENGDNWYNINLPVFMFQFNPCPKDIQDYVYNILFSYCKEHFTIRRWYKVGFPTAGTVKHMVSFKFTEKVLNQKNDLFEERRSPLWMRKTTSGLTFDYLTKEAIRQEMTKTICKEINDRITEDFDAIITKIIKFVANKMTRELTHIRKLHTTPIKNE